MIYTSEYIKARCTGTVRIQYPDGAVFEKTTIDPDGYMARWILAAAYNAPGGITRAQAEADHLRRAHRDAGRDWAT